MKYQESFKNRAKQLRRAGKTYSEIQKKLKQHIPKSTLSNWCKDVKLPKEYQERIRKIVLKNAHKGRAVALVVNRIKRERYLAGLRERNKMFFGEINKITEKKLEKAALAMLYIGKGTKWKNNRGLKLGNSNSNIIRIYLRLLKKIYGIEPSDLKCQVLYRADQNLDKLQRYWSKVTGIPLKNFYKTRPDPRTVGKKIRKKEYKGVCVILGGGTEIQLELEMIPEILFLDR